MKTVHKFSVFHTPYLLGFSLAKVDNLSGFNDLRYSSIGFTAIDEEVENLHKL